MQSLRYYKLFICCSTPEAIAYLEFEWSRSKFYGTFNEFLKITIELKEVWWVHSPMKIWVAII